MRYCSAGFLSLFIVDTLRSQINTYQLDRAAACQTERIVKAYGSDLRLLLSKDARAGERDGGDYVQT